MTCPACRGSVPCLSSRIRGRCMRFANLRYNRANETAAEGKAGHISGYREAPRKRGNSFRGDRGGASGCAPPLSCGLKVHRSRRP